MGIYLLSANTHDSGTPAVIEITSGLTATYNEYQFHIVNLHPATNNVNLTFQVNSGYDAPMVTTTFRAYLNESGSGGTFAYDSSSDQPSSGGDGEDFQRILSTGTGNDNDQSVSGILTLYAPASTVYVKHCIAEGNGYDHGDWTVNSHTSGYINTTDAITQIKFMFDSGNIDAGTIYMYGVS